MPMTLIGHRERRRILIGLRAKLKGLMLYAMGEATRHEIAENDAGQMLSVLEDQIDFHTAAVNRLEAAAEHHP